MEKRITKQDSTRTVIDAMNHYLTTGPYGHCTLSFYTSGGETALTFRQGLEVIFEVKECKNIEAAYEELLEFIITKAFPI